MRPYLTLPCCILLAAACGDDGGSGTPDARSFDASQPADAMVDALGPDGSAVGLPENPPEPLPTGAPDATLVTFNTALTTTIKYAEEREPLIIDAIRNLDADVVCIQEAWDLVSNHAAIAAQVQAEWPYAFWSWVDTKSWGNGLLILSKHPLYRGRALRYEQNDTNDLLDRMVIAADVLTDDSYFHVLCTHLHHVREDVDIRKAEIAELETWADAEGYLDGPAFLLGDFNTGPKTSPSTCDPDCLPQDTDSYDALLTTWTDPDAGWDQCTYCRAIADPMQVLEPETDAPDARIDHCFYRNIGDSEHTGSQIVLDQEIQVTDDQEGEVTTHYSDHLAVSCSFAPPAQ